MDMYRAALQTKQEQDSSEHIAPENELSKLVVNRLRSDDLDQIVTLQARPFGSGFLQARYHHGPGTPEIVFHKKSNLELIPGQDLTVITYWNLHANSDAKLAFASSAANIILVNTSSCSLDTSFKGQLCELISAETGVALN
ncbi:MAG: hypothetical protein OIF40_12915 [Mangrovicoccus sp.]|nr:hypothetical protein [Mangrovicoccus sp.]